MRGILMDREDFDVADYVRRATGPALAGVNGGLEQVGGRLRDTASWSDEVGHWLAVTASVPSRPDALVRSSRVLLPASGPDKDAELAGAIFGVTFTEDLLTRLKDAEAVDGVITL